MVNAVTILSLTPGSARCLRRGKAANRFTGLSGALKKPRKLSGLRTLALAFRTPLKAEGATFGGVAMDQVPQAHHENDSPWLSRVTAGICQVPAHLLDFGLVLCENRIHELVGNSLRGCGLLGVRLCLVFIIVWKNLGSGASPASRRAIPSERKRDGRQNGRNIYLQLTSRGSDRLFFVQGANPRHEPRSSSGSRGGYRVRRDRNYDGVYLGSEAYKNLGDRRRLQFCRLPSAGDNSRLLALSNVKTAIDFGKTIAEEAR